ncbi:hypothetical protein ATF84_1235 [[Clostridium] innocuum]|nr:hypothetical protein ATF84_1314 [[Clostridium] innocuum]PWJ10143.1 hypothetical protein ATF84_1235 [[Clostridium] innocuum]SSA48950.1 hypothetical protein SAMN04487929_1235 [[Clostridium] innocuum]SSA49621.1 hypothetical protein SAMN04487929_1314 [[Clostridium] innocuum]
MKYYIEWFFTIVYYTGFILYSLLWFLIMKLGLDSNWFLLLNTLTAVFIYYTARYNLFGFGYSTYFLLYILIFFYIYNPLSYFIDVIMPNTEHIFPLSYQTICVLSSIFYYSIIAVIIDFQNALTRIRNRKKKCDTH